MLATTFKVPLVNEFIFYWNIILSPVLVFFAYKEF